MRRVARGGFARATEEEATAELDALSALPSFVLTVDEDAVVFTSSLVLVLAVSTVLAPWLITNQSTLASSADWLIRLMSKLILLKEPRNLRWRPGKRRMHSKPVTLAANQSLVQAHSKVVESSSHA